MKLNARELATVLAALRLFQEHRPEQMIHFTEVTPLNGLEIDALCERVNHADNLALKEAVIVGGEPIPDKDKPGHIRITKRKLTCPHCGEDALKNYYESIDNRRSVNGLKKIAGKLTLDIESFYETDGGDEEGDNPRLGCAECGEYCSIPEAVDVEFS